MNEYRFEVCANSVESCLAAQDGGADRVELCAGIPEGGTTPSYGEIAAARRALTRTRLHVIIRPRGGDFLYTPEELERMADDIRVCRALGVDGVVFGCLDAEAGIDRAACDRLRAAAEGMSVTFHRAFDHTRCPMEALAWLNAAGYDRVLTSGQMPTAELGADNLAAYRQVLDRRRAEGHLIVLAGCGVNETNIRAIHDRAGVCEFHFSARVPVASAMRWRNPAVYMGDKGADETAILRTSAERVRRTIAALAEG